MASASGRFLTCVANPYFVGESDDPYAYQNRGRPIPAELHSSPARLLSALPLLTSTRADCRTRERELTRARGLMLFAQRQASEEAMGKAILLVLAVASVGAVAPSAAAGGLAYCIKGCDFGGSAGECSFSTYQQCQATASGVTPPARQIPIHAKASAARSRPPVPKEVLMRILL